MNPKYRREKTQLRWWFSANDIDGKTVSPGDILFSPSGIRFLVVERYKVAPAVPEVAGEVEAVSAPFDMVGIDKPSKWSRLLLDPALAAKEITRTLGELFTGAVRAIYGSPAGASTDKGAALRKLDVAIASGTIADALEAARIARQAFGIAQPDPPPNSDVGGPTTQSAATGGPAQQTPPGINWWGVAKVAALFGALAGAASLLDDED